jgi:hypothetical protein
MVAQSLYFVFSNCWQEFEFCSCALALSDAKPIVLSLLMKPDTYNYVGIRRYPALVFDRHPRHSSSRTSSYVSFKLGPLLRHHIRENINRSPMIIAMSRLLPRRIQSLNIISPARSAPAKFRGFHSTAPSMVSASDISPSRGENTEELTKQTTALVDSGRWKLWDNGKGLERQFRFKTFKATWVCFVYVISISTSPFCKIPPPSG